MFNGNAGLRQHPLLADTRFELLPSDWSARASALRSLAAGLLQVEFE